MATHFILTLMTNNSDMLLGQVIARIEQSAAQLGIAATKQRVLAQACAVDWYFAASASQAVSLKQQLLTYVQAERLPVDIALQPDNNLRRKKLFLADMDSTMIEQECIDEIADFAGMKPQVSEITEQAMQGKLDFIQALEARVELLKGLPESVLEQVYQERLTLMPGAKPLIATMKKHGTMCVLVSGGFTYFTARIAARLGFDCDKSNLLEIKEGALTGKVIPPIRDKHAKLQFLQQYRDELHLELSEVMAVGDGANDVPMLQAAGVGVAYHAKPVVQQSVDYCINHTDLTSLLYIQGYMRDEWVDAA